MEDIYIYFSSCLNHVAYLLLVVIMVLATCSFFFSILRDMLMFLSGYCAEFDPFFI